MGPPASDRVTRVRSYSGSTLHLVHFAYGTFTPCGLPFQASSAMNAMLSMSVLNPMDESMVWPFPFRSPLLREIDVSFSSSGYLDVSVPRVASPARLCIHRAAPRHYPLSGFPHSDICGLTDICSSPQLFAACRVLHRLPVPRHPPYALLHLTK